MIDARTIARNAVLGHDGATNPWCVGQERRDLYSDFRRRIQAAGTLAAAEPTLTDDCIAERSELTERYVPGVRLLASGAIPRLGHNDTVWWLLLYAFSVGLHAHREQSFSLGGRRRITPDLIVCQSLTGPVLFVVEVKTNLSRVEESKGIRQVARYVEIVGEGRPVLTAFRAPERDGDVAVWPLRRLCAEMRQAAAA